MKKKEELVKELGDLMFKDGRGFKVTTTSMTWYLEQETEADKKDAIKVAFKSVAKFSMKDLSERGLSQQSKDEIIDAVYKEYEQLLKKLFAFYAK